METIKRQLLFSGQEGLQELKKFAICFEEKIYTTTTNQYDYLRKISLEMLSMEIRSQNAMPTAPMDPAASLDSTEQTGHAKGVDWQEEIYQKETNFAEQFYNEKLVTDVLKTGVEEWLRVHGDHVKSEAVEKAITQIMIGEEAEEMSRRAKKRPGRLLKKVDLLAPISML